MRFISDLKQEQLSPQPEVKVLPDPVLQPENVNEEEPSFEEE
jgi:hypothetical protein